MNIVKRCFVPPAKQSFFLFGPRGTGKSTWAKMYYPEALYLDLLRPDLKRKLESHPEELVKVIKAHKKSKKVILDEIQKVPELLNLVHALIEEKKGMQFILTGSSSRKLKREGVDLLAGRALKKQMHPFLASEIDHQFDLSKALKFGMLPLIWEVEEPQEVLDSYVDLYIIEEVQFEGIVRNIGNFSRFLSIIAFSHGSPINITNIARECEVKRSTTENFLEILKDLMLSYEIPIFEKRAKRRLAAHPKFYLFDCGIFQTMRKTGPLDSANEIDGGALEGLILEHLKAWCHYSKGNYAVYYWRTKSGLEVDFIVYGEEGFWAIEVKNKMVIGPKDLKGLKHFMEDYPECTPLLLYRGVMKRQEGAILCLPCEEFLKTVVPNTPLLKKSF